MEQSPYSPPNPSTNPLFKSSPLEALKASVQSPNWVGNLLWLSIAGLTSGFFIGQIALFGYGSELLARRAGRPENPSPDIDANRLGDYISKGIWPFLVHFLVQLAASMLIIFPATLLLVGGMALVSAGGGDDAVAASMIFFMPILFLLSLAVYVLSVPFLIRAMVCQDFQKSFDVAWSMGFMKLMFWEIVVSSILFGVLSMMLTLVGLAAFCVGYVPAIGLVMGGLVNLLAQWYEIYLSLGGEPAPAAVNPYGSAPYRPDQDDIIDASIV